MYYQKAQDEDYQGMLNLQHKNFILNLSDAEKEYGFLSVEFTYEQFKTMNEESGIVICKDKDIIGYICTSSPEFNMTFPLPKAMITLYPQFKFKEKPLNIYESIVIGPWCIEQDSRGKGIFMNMWSMLENILPNYIDLLTTFVSTNNKPSLLVSQRAGMEVVTKFKFEQNEFFLLAKLVSH